MIISLSVDDLVGSNTQSNTIICIHISVMVALHYVHWKYFVSITMLYIVPYYSSTY
jgi:hypothetical protein